MNTETMISDVLPEGSVLFKHNHGYFSFYKTEDGFIKGDDFLTQKVDEFFTDFIKRVLSALILIEIYDDEPIVTIDCAIHGGF